MTNTFLFLIEMNPLLRTVFLVLFFTGMFLVVFSRIWVFAEQQYAERFYRPFFRYPIIFPRNISDSAQDILEREFTFYNQLSSADQKCFRHRLSTIMSSIEFHTKEDLELIETMPVLISSTIVMMTMGFRDYTLPNLERVVIYPGPYHSELGDDLHKGEYSPSFKTLIFSWSDFLKGYDITNDNLNLAIHEFSHVLHIKCYFGEDISSQIYNDGFDALKQFLRDHDAMRQALIKTDYFRSYAFTNEVEFIAVLIECFFETPNDFKREFFEIYDLVRRMLNFRDFN